MTDVVGCGYTTEAGGALTVFERRDGRIRDRRTDDDGGHAAPSADLRR